MSHNRIIGGNGVIFVCSLLTLAMIGPKMTINAILTETNELDCVHIQCPITCPADSYLKSSDDEDDIEEEDLDDSTYVEELGTFDLPPTLIDLQLHHQLSKREVFSQHELERCCGNQHCACRECDEVPQCNDDQVAIEVHRGQHEPGNCCSVYKCIAKVQCAFGIKQTYWKNKCTKCSCFGEGEMCENLCPEEDALQNCYSDYWQRIMANGESWSEGSCVSCVCEQGDRRCLTPFCKMLDCKRTVTDEDECCPRCALDGEGDDEVPGEEHENVPIPEVMSKEMSADGNSTAATTEKPSTTEPTVNVAATNSTLPMPVIVIDSTTTTSENTSTAIDQTPSTTENSNITADQSFGNSSSTSDDLRSTTAYINSSTESSSTAYMNIADNSTTPAIESSLSPKSVVATTVENTIESSTASTTETETSSSTAVETESSFGTTTPYSSLQTANTSPSPPVNMTIVETVTQPAESGTTDVSTTQLTMEEVSSTVDNNTAATEETSTISAVGEKMDHSPTTMNTSSSQGPTSETTPLETDKTSEDINSNSYPSTFNPTTDSTTSNEKISTGEPKTIAINTTNTPIDISSSTFEEATNSGESVATTSSPFTATLDFSTQSSVSSAGSSIHHSYSSTSSTTAPEPLEPLYQQKPIPFDSVDYGTQSTQNQMRTVFDKIDYVVMIVLFIGALLCIALGLIIRHTKNRKKMYSSIPNSETSLSQTSTNTTMTV